MRSEKRLGVATLVSLLCALRFCEVACAQSIVPAAPGMRADAPIDPNRPHGQELYSSAAPDLFILAAGPVSLDLRAATLPSWDPKVIELLNGRAFPASTTVSVTDLETTLIDPATFNGYPYAWEGSRAYAANPGIALELKSRGISMLARANSHALDWGIEGMRMTSASLDAAGLKHAGTGEQEGLARMASYLDEPAGKGRIALLATALSYRPTTNALSSHGVAPARPGISGIELVPRRFVPLQDRVQLQRMACRFQYPSDPGQCAQLPAPPTSVSLFGSRFESAADPKADYTSDYEINLVHAANELRSVREAKQNSDLVVFSVSVGQTEFSDPEPASSSLLMRLAHAAVDAGADLVMVTGPSSLGPIEIYRPGEGWPRPILYGMGRFYGSADVVQKSAQSDEDSIIVRTNIDGSRLRVEIYPIDVSSRDGVAGIPRLADARRGRAILERVQHLSTAYGTLIRTEAFGATVRGIITADAGINPVRVRAHE